MTFIYKPVFKTRSLEMFEFSLSWM